MSAASPPPLPLPQSPAYARLLHHLSVEAQWRDLPGGRCLVQSRRFGPLGHVSLISRGPVTAAPQAALDGLRALAATCPGPLVVNAPALDADGLRDAGFWPLLTPATVGLVRLGTQPQMRARLKAKWRNRLRRAEAAGLQVTLRPLPDRHWLLEAEARQQKARRYRGAPPDLWTVYNRVNPGQALVVEAQRGSEPLAAGLFLLHNTTATYQISVTLPEGRAASAMTLILWQAMTALAARGMHWLDLGTLDTVHAPGLAQFKLGTGAVAQTLGGTWLHLPWLAPAARRLPAALCH